MVYIFIEYLYLRVYIACMWNLELAKQLIEEKGFRRDFVASNIGVASGTLASYLTGRLKPGKAVLINMARLLETTVEELESKKFKAS